MKNTDALKNVTGLTQDEMAMLLGVTASQWSMYKSGKRDLPHPAMLQFAKFLANAHEGKSVSAESKKINAAEQKKQKEWLLREHLGLSAKQGVLERKINVLEKIRLECFAALETAHFIETQNSKDSDLIQVIRTRATNTLNKHSLLRLEELKLKKEQVEILKDKVAERIKQQ